MQVSTDYSTLLSTLCTGGTDTCTTAINSVSGACWTLIDRGDGSVCSGTCATQLNAVVSACGSSVSLIV